MGVGETFKDTYYSLEDKWYALVDNISETVPAVGKGIDFIEEKGIPSFPLAIILVIVLILLLFWVFTANAVSPLTVIVTDDNGTLLSGATVSAFSGENIIASQDTDNSGVATLSLTGGTYTVKIEKDGYVSSSREMTSGSEETIKLALSNATTTKTVLMKNASGQIVSGSGTVQYYCKGNESDVMTAFYTNGKFDADFGNACTEIVIQSISGYKVLNGVASFSSGSVTVEEGEVNTGTVRVNLSSTESIPPGLRVVLTSEDGATQTYKVTETGVVVFSDVITKKYYVTVYDARTDSDTKFSTYEGNKVGDLKDVTTGATTEFNITLQKAPSAKITVVVRDVETSAPISGAEVTLTPANNSTQVDKQVTGATGTIVFNVSNDESYTVSAEHSDYLIGTSAATKSATASSASVELFLVKATVENSQSLHVNVTDASGAPIDNVKLVLKKLDETEIDSTSTGATGSGDFYNLDIGQYYVFASKDAFSANSQTVQVLPRKQSNLDIKLDIGKGTVHLTVLDPENNPLKGAIIKEINYYTQKQEEQKTSDTLGIADFTVRLDKTVYYTIESGDLLKYTTANVKLTNDGETFNKQVVMVNKTNQLTAKILPITTSDATVEGTSGNTTISAGVYTITAVLSVPKGTFTEAGLHLRTGKATEGVTNTMEEDNAKITGINSAATKVVKGTTFTPPSGTDTDNKNLTSGDAKWVNLTWKSPSEGAYEAEAEVTISDINPNQPVNFWYRGWAKGASTLKDPSSTNTSNELYSTAKNYIMSGGASSLCVNGICRAYTIQVMSGSEAGRKLYIGNTFNGKKGIEYELTAEITNNTGRNISGAVLNLDTVGLDINTISINGVEYNDKQISLGSIGVDGYLQVKVLFTTTSAGTDSLKLSINSSTKTEFENTITITVPQNKVFTLDIIPKEIVPYIKNTMYFTATDGNDVVQGVLIEIKNGTHVLTTLTTSSEGIASYILPEPSISDTIYITAQKEGYDTLEISKAVDESILLVTPPEINETIKIGEVKSITQTILVENATPAQVKITSVDFSGDLKTYLDMKFSDTLIGTTIETGKDSNYSLTIKANSTATKLIEPKTVSGNIIFTVEVAGTNQQFETTIPVNIRLSMPGFIDSANCLKITPTSLEFSATNSEVTKTIDIENTCTAEGVGVTLHNIQAKVNEASKLGAITVTGSGFNGALSDTYTKIGELLDKSNKTSLTIKFIPSGAVNSGTQDLTISFKGDNVPEEDVTESVEASVKAKITMSNLTKCITVQNPDGGITLDVAGWNLGYNRLLNTNINSQLGAYGSQYQGFANRGPTMPYGYQSALPFMSGAQYGQGQQQAPNSSYDQSSFIISNSCATDVDIELVPDTQVNVSQQKFTLGKDDDISVTVTPGYTLGKYKIVVNAKATNTSDTKKNIDTVSVLVRKLGDIDRDCIKVNTTQINLNSFIYTPEKYKAYNYCYDSGVQLARGNNAVTVQCDAPNQILTPLNNGYSPVAGGGQPFLQQGMEGLYGSQYPLNNVYNSYYNYLQSPGCGGNQCVMVTGTRVYSQTLLEGEKGTTEEVTFEVMPNPSYMPQRRLFNNNTGQYGLFQSLGDIRAWLTETDARTNIYGNINVQYTNQYGSSQCMNFPVTIEDNWRVLESIDSAINWGDPGAAPGECVQGENKDKSLDIYGYWKIRGNANGAIPETEYRNNGLYLYVPTVPAVKIGAAPNQRFTSQQFYPSNSWTQSDSTKDSDNVSRNCGLLDRISNLQYEKEFAGVVISVETTMQGGSIINNTKGPNLLVSINRTNIQQNCVYIETMVRGKLTRAINLQSGEVMWPFTALVTKPGYKVKGASLEQVKAECAIGASNIPIDQNQANLQNTCSTDSKKFGFNLIKETNANNINETTCTDEFCSSEMLNVFIKARVKNILTERDSADVCKYSNGLVSQLYKEAPTISIATTCTSTDTTAFYNGDNGLVSEAFTIKQTTSNKSLIDGVKSGSTSGVVGPILQMNTLLDDSDVIPIKLKERILLKISKDGAPTDITNKKLGIETDGKYYYMSFDSYKNLNSAIGDKFNDCNISGSNCTINLCGNSVTIEPSTMKWLAEKAQGLIIGTRTTDADTNKLEQEKVISQNVKLKNIMKWAVLDTNSTIATTKKELYLAQINPSKLPTDEALSTANLSTYKDYTISYTIGTDKKTSVPVGKYKALIDINLCTDAPKTIDVNLTEVSLTEAPDAKKNVVLLKDLTAIVDTKSTTDTSKGTLLTSDDKSGIIYSRTPIKLNVTLNASETALNYAVNDLSSQITSLIKWYEGKNASTDAKSSGDNFTYIIKSQSSANKTLTGIYYQTENKALVFLPNKFGGTVSASIPNNVTGSINSPSGTIPSNPNAAPFNVVASNYNTNFTLDNVITSVNNNTACITTDGSSIIWNETELLK